MFLNSLFYGKLNFTKMWKRTQVQYVKLNNNEYLVIKRLKNFERNKNSTNIVKTI